MAQVDPATRAISYSGIGVRISQAFADALNDAFAKPKGTGAVFSGGDLLGTLGLDAQAQ